MVCGVGDGFDVGEGAEAFAYLFDALFLTFYDGEGVDGQGAVFEVEADGDVVEVGIDGDELDAASEVSERVGDDVFAGYAF